MENYLSEQWALDQAARVMAWRNGQRPGPALIELFPTNRCNLQCKHCWQRGDDYDKTYKSEMSDERLEALVDEAHEMGVQHWFIKGGGEPLARGKLFMRMARHIIELGMNGALYTNGALFKDSQIDELCDMGWSAVYFSIDSPDEEINDYIRTGGFAKAKTAMERFRDWRVQNNSVLPLTYINMVVTRYNRKQLSEMIQFASDMGCAAVTFSGLIEFTSLCKEFRLSPEEHREMLQDAQHARELANSLRIGHNIGDYLEEDSAGEAREMSFGEPYAEARDLTETLCYSPFHSVTIHPDGKVGPCCMSYDERSNNLQTASLQEVWEGSYLSSVRDHFRRNVPMSYCAQCPTFLYHGIETTRRIVKDRARFQDANPVGRASILAGKTIRALSNDGLSGTVRKAREWLELNRS